MIRVKGEGPVGSRELSLVLSHSRPVAAVFARKYGQFQVALVGEAFATVKFKLVSPVHLRQRRRLPSHIAVRYHVADLPFLVIGPGIPRPLDPAESEVLTVLSVVLGLAESFTHILERVPAPLQSWRSRSFCLEPGPPLDRREPSRRSRRHLCLSHRPCLYHGRSPDRGISGLIPALFEEGMPGDRTGKGRDRGTDGRPGFRADALRKPRNGGTETVPAGRLLFSTACCRSGCGEAELREHLARPMEEGLLPAASSAGRRPR